jgi:hypothetical protein
MLFVTLIALTIAKIFIAKSAITMVWTMVCTGCEVLFAIAGRGHMESRQKAVTRHLAPSTAESEGNANA